MGAEPPRSRHSWALTQVLSWHRHSCPTNKPAAPPIAVSMCGRTELSKTSAYKAFFNSRFRPDKVVLGILTWQHGMAFGHCGQPFRSQSECGRRQSCSKREEVCGSQPFIGWQTWKVPCLLRRENSIWCVLGKLA